MSSNADYREMIVDMVGKIKSQKLLKRIYALTEYLFLHEDGGAVNE